MIAGNISNTDKEGSRGSGFAQHQGFGRTKHDLATALGENAFAPPLTQKAACSEYGDVRFVGQLLIPDIESDPLLNPLPHAVGQTTEHLGKPLACVLASRRKVKGAIYHHI